MKLRRAVPVNGSLCTYCFVLVEQACRVLPLDLFEPNRRKSYHGNTSSLTMTPYLDPQSMRDVKYGFYHPEDTGYMHVRHLGHGIQGTVTLVRCAITGELLVRKRRHFEHNNGTVDNELTFSRAISHPNVTNPVVEQKYFDNSNPPKVSVVSYWQYYNCGDLTTLINKHRRLGHRVPEVVIWRYLSQILGAIYQTHLQGVAHMDGHKANILVHWGEGDILPTFALGDWGKAVVLPSEAHDPLVHPGLGWEAGTESIDDTQTIPPDESLPELSLDALYNHQPHTPALPRTELCLASIANDFEFLNENLEPLMSASTDLLHPPREDEEDDEDMPFESDSDSGGSDHSSKQRGTALRPRPPKSTRIIPSRPQYPYIQTLPTALRAAVRVHPITRSAMAGISVDRRCVADSAGRTS